MRIGALEVPAILVHLSRTFTQFLGTNVHSTFKKATTAFFSCLHIHYSGSIPGRGNDGICSLRRHIQTETRARPTPYPISNGDYYPGRNATRA
jgi:hypothetical protein